MQQPDLTRKGFTQFALEMQTKPGIAQQSSPAASARSGAQSTGEADGRPAGRTGCSLPNAPGRTRSRGAGR